MSKLHYVDGKNNTDFVISIECDNDSYCYNEEIGNIVSFVPRELSSVGSEVKYIDEDWIKELIAVKSDASERHHWIDLDETRVNFAENSFFPVLFEAYIHGGISVGVMGSCNIDRAWDVTSPAGVVLITKAEAQYVLNRDKNKIDFCTLTADETKALNDYGQQIIHDLDLVLNGSRYGFSVEGVYKGEDIENSCWGFGPYEMWGENAVDDILSEALCVEMDDYIESLLREKFLHYLDPDLDAADEEIEIIQSVFEIKNSETISMGDISDKTFCALVDLINKAAGGEDIGGKAKALVYEINEELLFGKPDAVER